MKVFCNRLIPIILITFLGTIVYSNTFFCSFHFDDVNFIVDNYFIKDIHNLLNIWKFYPCRFIALLSIAFNYHINGLDVFGYHLFNLAVHLISAILVWWLTLLTLATPAMYEGTIEKNTIEKKTSLKTNRILPVLKQLPKSSISGHANLIALFVGLIFVSHPVQTEAVTYIWQRSASLVALFYLASLCFYVKSRLLLNKQPTSGLGRFCYICALMTAIVAMFTKESAITLPLMILLYEFSFLRTNKFLNWIYVIPFLFTLFIIPSLILFTKSEMTQKIHVVIGNATGISPYHYLLTQFRVIVTYIRLLFVPINQNLDYDFPVYKNIFELPVLTSFLFLTAILYFAKRLFLKYRLISFSLFLFFLTLLPESSFLTLEDVIFEHRLYLPLVGYSMLLVSGVYYLFGKNAIKTMVIALTMIVAFNSFLTYQRNKIWKDDFTLWDDTVHKSPHKARPYNGRGLCYYKQGNLIQAMSDFNKAIETDPDYAEPYNNRGAIYNSQGNFTKAISDFNKDIELSPNDIEAFNNRGSTYVKTGHFTQAVFDYNKVLELNPNYTQAYYNRASAYDDLGRYTQAISDYNKAIELNPNYTEAYNNRGSAYYKLGNITQAISDYNKAIDLNSTYTGAYNNRGVAFAQKGFLSEAVADYNKAIEINPNNAESYLNRGFIYYKLGKFIQAILDFNKAIEVNPVYAEAYNDRGSAYAQQGKLDEAMSDYNKAIEINPNYAGAYSNRGFNYDKQGNSTLAIADLNKAIELNPQYTDAYINRGNAYAKQNNLTQAIADYTKVIEINPLYSLAYDNRAILFYQLKEYDKAWADVHKEKALGASVNPGLISALKQVSPP